MACFAAFRGFRHLFESGPHEPCSVRTGVAHQSTHINLFIGAGTLVEPFTIKFASLIFHQIAEIDIGEASIAHRWYDGFLPQVRGPSGLNKVNAWSDISFVTDEYRI